MSTQSRLSGKVAVVTGASKGIGAAVAKRLAEEGSSVVVNYASSKAGADKVVDEIAAEGGRAVAVQADVAKKADIERLFAEAKKAYGAVDILVNNAGVYEFASLESVTEEHFHRQFNGTGGSVINISSVASIATPAGAAVYSATKAAVDAVTKALAKELGPQKIRVNAVNPGMVETEGTHSAGIIESEFHKQVESQTPLGRIGQPGDIASAVAFLASSDSDWLTGETIVIAGGFR
ncbi:MAG TPA: SDR family oxidoreductase [Terrimicrobiaceae bacterium]|nr:SDR family oxidoreductase [Terrimicrobiaceae bacterium]